MIWLRWPGARVSCRLPSSSSVRRSGRPPCRARGPRPWFLPEGRPVPDYFAAFLDLRGRRCLVVGGGTVGERKVRDLLACGASVTVVSPALTPGLTVLARSAAVAWKPRRFLRTDVRRCRLVIAATGIASVDR